MYVLYKPQQGLPALNFRGRAEKAVVHMYWLTWLDWHPCTYVIINK